MRYYAFDGTKNIMVDQTPLGLLRIVVSIGRISTFFPTGYNWLQLVKGGQGATLNSNITALDAKGRLFVLCIPRRVLAPSQPSLFGHYQY